MVLFGDVPRRGVVRDDGTRDGAVGDFASGKDSDYGWRVLGLDTFAA